MRPTSRGLDGLCGVAEALHQASTGIVADFFTDVAGGSLTVPWLVVFRGFDETPIITTFNTMYSELAPVAKYFWRPSPSAAYECMTFDEMVQKYPGRRQVRFGCNEFMAQTLRIAWREVSGGGGRDVSEDVVVRPVFVANTKASTLYEAFEKAHENLSIDALIRGCFCL